jgi:thiol-disulfide isomerase/thioredoxin
LPILYILLLFWTALGCTPASQTLTPTSEPYIAPDFTLAALDGATYTLSELRGRWVVVNFWATWCLPCIEEMPALQQIADEYRESLVVLGINMREDVLDIAPFIDAYAIRYPILLNPDDATLIAYNVVNLPQTLIVAPDGELVYRSFGPLTAAAFEAEFEALQGGG